MGNFLITGVAGTGKTSVAGELSKRGFTAYSTDEIPTATRMQDRHTKELVPVVHPVDWDQFAWNWQADGLQALLDSAETVFIAGYPSNLSDFHHLFEKIFVLTIDQATLSHRLVTRTTGSYGKTASERRVVLDSYEPSFESFLEIGGIPISNTRPLERVADEILSHAGAPVF